METATLYAYQITPGNDNLLFFAETLEQCQAAALEQRRDLARMTPTPTSLTQALLRVLNEETSLVEACVVERKLVALVTD
ncbi:hypothetical protein [Sinorhizobium americanum]|uniref:Uncharacterized protein n=1 Tax=Sinorhizobium americanum TaxID=194963 RepID=A0A4R2BX55_9HYPH|nr:hypothetical protein [Sinorhizobium americanum]TCN32467.1 hypothetical protein EV184_104133 [Sinorhizobium americanum]